MTSSDTHDNGREEQWRKVVGGHDDSIAYLDAGRDGDGGWFEMPEELIDAIVADHAQAGLAQRYREALERIVDHTNLRWDSYMQKYGLSLTDSNYETDSEIARDALTAGREAAAE